MKNRILLGLLFIAISSNVVLAQKRQKGELIIGDQLPDMELTYIQNGQQQTVNTKDLKGKLVILDFWNIWCSTCIAAMPKMLAYQKEFDKDLKVIYVTENSKQQIEDHFDKIEKRSNGTKDYAHRALKELPSIIKDSVFHQMFPHLGKPHTVLIKDGIVKYITFGTDMTSERIRAVIDGKETDLLNRKTSKAFDHKSPLYKEGEGRLLPYLKYYSMLYKEVQEWHNMFSEEVNDSINDIYRFKRVNMNIPELYRTSIIDVNRSKLLYDNRRILETSDSTRYFWPKESSKTSAWRRENLYSYELSIPLNQKDDAGKIILEDLNRFLPSTVAFEKHKVKCLVMVRNKKGERYQYDGKQTIEVGEYKEGVYKAIGGTMSDLLSRGLFAFNSGSKIPVIDGTEYDGKINVVLKSRYKDLNTIRKELQTYDLDLVEKEMEIEMLVIRDKK